MAALLLDALARRRVAREEALVRAQLAAASPRMRRILLDESSTDDEEEDDGGTGRGQERQRQRRCDRPPAKPFVPCCCFDGEPKDKPLNFPIEVIRDVDYSGDDDGSGTGLLAGGALKMDVYYSPVALHRHMRACGERSVPVTLHVHGGGWQRGHKGSEWRGGPNAGRASARHGLVACVVSYRLHPSSAVVGMVWATLLSGLLCTIASVLSSWVRDDFLLRWMQLWLLIVVSVGTYHWRTRATKAMHPHACLDVARAVAWIKRHLREHVPEADPDRLFLSGHSAGAHLVSLLATDPQYLRRVGLSSKPADEIRGVCAVSGIYCLHGPCADSPSALRNKLFRFAYTSAFGRGKDLLDAASPLHQAREGAPPFLLVSAASDMGLEIDAARFAKRLRELHVPVLHVTVPNTSHSTIASHFERHQAHKHYFQFVLQCCANTFRQAAAQTTDQLSLAAATLADDALSNGSTNAVIASVAAAEVDVGPCCPGSPSPSRRSNSTAAVVVSPAAAPSKKKTKNRSRKKARSVRIE
jgi:acetyl esterase/lipase